MIIKKDAWLAVLQHQAQPEVEITALRELLQWTNGWAWNGGNLKTAEAISWLLGERKNDYFTSSEEVAWYLAGCACSQH